MKKIAVVTNDEKDFLNSKKDSNNEYVYISKPSDLMGHTFDKIDKISPYDDKLYDVAHRRLTIR